MGGGVVGSCDNCLIKVECVERIVKKVTIGDDDESIPVGVALIRLYQILDNCDRNSSMRNLSPDDKDKGLKLCSGCGELLSLILNSALTLFRLMKKEGGLARVVKEEVRKRRGRDLEDEREHVEIKKELIEDEEDNDHDGIMDMMMVEMAEPLSPALSEPTDKPVRSSKRLSRVKKVKAEPDGWINPQEEEEDNDDNPKVNPDPDNDNEEVKGAGPSDSDYSEPNDSDDSDNDSSDEDYAIDNSSGPYPCHNCPRIFKSLKFFTQHLEDHKISGRLKRGGRRKYKNNKKKKVKNKEDNANPPKKSTSEYPCTLCPRIYNSLKLFKNHQDHHAQGRIDPTGKLKDKRHPCPHPGCGAMVVSGQLKRHEESVHSKERKYLCDHCGKSYLKKSGLEKHKRNHTNPKRLPCPYPGCDKGFTRNEYLNTHIIAAHEFKEPVLCPVCGKQFIHQKTLDGHMTIHDEKKSKERLYCPVCDKMFSTNYNLKVHNKTVHEGMRIERERGSGRKRNKLEELLRGRELNVNSGIGE